MTCKDCIHYGLCETNGNAEIFVRGIENICGYFKDKSKSIELPCKVGDTAYCIWNFNEPEIQECVVKEFRFQCSGMYICLAYVDCIGQYNHSSFLIRNLNKTWFLTKSEAEQKLKELKENANS